MMDLYALIKEDHASLRSQLASMLASSQQGRPLNKGALDVLKALLVAHSRAEEHILYEQFKASSVALPLAYDSYEEHLLTERLLRELENVSDARVLTARIRLLTELLERHMHREETEGFAFANEAIPTEKLPQLAEAFYELRRQIQADMMGETVNRRESFEDSQPEAF